jgi:hypothetical protein
MQSCSKDNQQLYVGIGVPMTIIVSVFCQWLWIIRPHGISDTE